MQPAATHQPFVESLAEAHVVMFPGADHGFTWPGWPNYNKVAADESFETTVSMFRNHLS